MTHPSTVADTLDAGHTPGPLSVRQDMVWPFVFHVVTADGTSAHSEPPICWTSKWNSVADMLELRGVYGEERDRWQAALSRQYADLHLRAAAPDMLAALETVQRNMRLGVTGTEARKGWDLVSAAIAKARGEVQP